MIPPSPPSTPPGDKRDRPTYIVGMGGSAGSLESFEQFFNKMPADSGLAFVVVSHLDPTQKDLLADLLQHSTAMKVSQAEDGDEVQADHVYVIPPGKDLSIAGGRLQLVDLPEDILDCQGKDRNRLQPLQEQHHQAPYREEDGSPPDH